MKNRKTTFTIGIPAYNEGENISRLLRSLFNQKVFAGKLQEIIIASDGSNDNTLDFVKSIKDKRIKVINGKDRFGKAYRQNQIIDRVTSDILVLLDADIEINDPYFLQKLILPVIEESADLTSVGIEEFLPQNFFEKSLAVGMRLKRILFKEFKEGNNLYNCHGPARALSRSLFRKIRFVESDGEDMFSYLFCVANGFRFQFVQDATVVYRLPGNYYDHLKQGYRFRKSQKRSYITFDSRLVKDEMEIPASVYFIAFLKSLMIIVKDPFYVFCYLLILTKVEIVSRSKRSLGELWLASSTKVFA